MPVFGWDASHFDGLLSTAILAKARAQGIGFFTHKIGEGTSYDDPNDKTALAAARDAGIPCLGGYQVVRSGDVAAQVDYAIRLADRDEPWWRDFPLWAWQVDLERWSYDNVPAASGADFGKRIRDKTGRQTLLYASRGQYGDSLTAWDGPLWNASYTAAGTRTALADLYPGDGWAAGWAPYSGKLPSILQFTSSATIAGLTTCDGNAFRGSQSDLEAFWKGGDMAGEADKAFSAPYTGTEPFISGQSYASKALEGPLRTANETLERIEQDVQAISGVDLDVLAGKISVQLAPLIPTAAQVAAQLIQQLAGQK